MQTGQAELEAMLSLKVKEKRRNSKAVEAHKNRQGFRREPDDGDFEENRTDSIPKQSGLNQII